MFDDAMKCDELMGAYHRSCLSAGLIITAHMYSRAHKLVHTHTMCMYGDDELNNRVRDAIVHVMDDADTKEEGLSSPFCGPDQQSPAIQQRGR